MAELTDNTAESRFEMPVEGGLTLLVSTQLLALGDAELTGKAGVDDLFQQALVGRQCTDLLGL